jgi:hypothetical protein
VTSGQLGEAGRDLRTETEHVEQVAPIGRVVVKGAEQGKSLAHPKVRL